MAFSQLVITAIIGICALMYVGVGGCLHVPQKKHVVAFTLVGVNRGELYVYLTLVEEVLTRLVSKFYIMGKSPGRRKLRLTAYGFYTTHDNRKQLPQC